MADTTAARFAGVELKSTESEPSFKNNVFPFKALRSDDENPATD